MKNRDFSAKFGMISFMIMIITFVLGSSFLYFNNTSNVEIKIKTDNAVNKEKTAINEALTKALVGKNDSISDFRRILKRKDSLYNIKIRYYEKVLERSKNEKDSLTTVIFNFKQSDLQPVGKN